MTKSDDGGDGSKKPSDQKKTSYAPPAPRQEQQQPAAPRSRQEQQPPPPGFSQTAAGAGSGGGIPVGGGAGGFGRPVDISATRPLKRKAAEFNAPEGVEPICFVCQRRFNSFKALFGHLRSHPDRGWRGCFPPPIFDDPQRPASRAGGRLALNFDLNVRPPQPQREESTANAEKNEIDLNKPPTADGDDQN